MLSLLFLCAQPISPEGLSRESPPRVTRVPRHRELPMATTLWPPSCSHHRSPSGVGFWGFGAARHLSGST